MGNCKSKKQKEKEYKELIDKEKLLIEIRKDTNGLIDDLIVFLEPIIKEYIIYAIDNNKYKKVNCQYHSIVICKNIIIKPLDISNFYCMKIASDVQDKLFSEFHDRMDITNIYQIFAAIRKNLKVWLQQIDISDKDYINNMKIDINDDDSIEVIFEIDKHKLFMYNNKEQLAHYLCELVKNINKLRYNFIDKSEEAALSNIILYNMYNKRLDNYNERKALTYSLIYKFIDKKINNAEKLLSKFRQNNNNLIQYEGIYLKDEKTFYRLCKIIYYIQSFKIDITVSHIQIAFTIMVKYDRLLTDTKFNDIINGQTYQDILLDHIIKYYDEHTDDFILQLKMPSLKRHPVEQPPSYQSDIDIPIIKI